MLGGVALAAIIADHLVLHLLYGCVYIFLCKIGNTTL